MASPVRRRRSPEKWQRLIAQQAESGQSQAAFCAEHGLALKTFQRWRRQLEPSASSALSTTVPAQQYDAVMAENSALQARLAALESELQAAQRRVAWFRRELFGAKSENAGRSIRRSRPACSLA